MILREAKVKDEQAVIELCHQIWPETDHLPSYWSRFLTDPATLSRVIEVEGQVVAVSFLEFKGNTAWWHGLRVAPAYQRLGLATRLLGHLIEESRRLGFSRLRFGASCDSKPMHHMAARQGFLTLSRHRYVCAGPLTGPDEVQPSVHSLEESDLDQIEGFLRASEGWRAGHRTACSVWVWEDVTRDFLRSLLEKGTIYACYDKGRIEGLALANQDREPDYTWLFIARIDGSAFGVEALGRHLRRLVSTLKAGADEECPVQGMVRDDPLIIAALLQAGYRFFPEEDMHLFELLL
jgi:GNAT superfamily N-acetyltransferase